MVSITTITIFTEGSPIYSSVIPIGANNVTNDLAIGLRFSLEDAEKIKLKLNKISESKKFEDEIDLSHFGILSEEKHKISLQTAINGIIKPRLEEIFHLIYDQIEDSGFHQQFPPELLLLVVEPKQLISKKFVQKLFLYHFELLHPPKVVVSLMIFSTRLYQFNWSFDLPLDNDSKTQQ